MVTYNREDDTIYSFLNRSVSTARRIMWPQMPEGTPSYATAQICVWWKSAARGRRAYTDLSATRVWGQLDCVTWTCIVLQSRQSAYPPAQALHQQNIVEWVDTPSSTPASELRADVAPEFQPGVT